MGKGNNSRPLLITILGILQILLGALILLGAVLTFTGMTIVGGIQAGAVGGGILAVAGLIELLVGIGFMSGWSIMWYLGVIVQVIGLLLNLVSLVFGNLTAILSIVIELIILLYLFKDNVKSFFLD